MFKLRDYQNEALDVIKNMNYGERKLIKIPTGGGKTIIFASLSANVEGRVLIVVPSKELREQAYEKIKTIDKDIDIGNVQANLDEVDSKIVVASRQSLTHKKSNRMQRMLEHGEFEYVIFDEVHQAVDQIRKIINKLNSNAKVIGFTATPYNKELKKVFKQIDFQREILDMILQDYLCEPKAIMVDSSTNLNHVKVVAGEFNQKELEEAVNNIERNQLIVEAYKKYSSNRKATIVFASGIDHCNSIVREFVRNGIECKSIDSTMKSEEREKVIEEFTTGKIPVLVNVAVLTTGFDYPATDCIILARPTKSKILYEQIIGRGLRVHEKKEDCLIIDINDVVKNHDLLNISSIFSMPIQHGETPRKAMVRIKKEKEEAEEKRKLEELRRIEEEKDRKEKVELRAKQIKLFNRDMETRIQETKYDWFKIDILTYVLSLAVDKHYVIEREDSEDGLTNYSCFLVCTNKDNKDIKFMKKQEDLKGLLIEIENRWIKWASSTVVKDSDWKLQSATENQLKYIPWARTKWDCHKYFTGNSIKSLMKKRGDYIDV